MLDCNGPLKRFVQRSGGKSDKGRSVAQINLPDDYGSAQEHNQEDRVEGLFVVLKVAVERPPTVRSVE